MPNYPYIHNNTPHFNWQPLPNPRYFIAGVIVMILLIAGLFSCARGDEPDWDKIVPIIIQIESSGNPNAISQDGCIGLMQINPIVMEEYNEENYYAFSDFTGKIDLNILFNPKFNKQVGTWYLQRIWYHYLPHYKIPQTIDNLLWAYNAGIGNVIKGIKSRETRNYIQRYHKLSRQR